MRYQLIECIQNSFKQPFFVIQFKFDSSSVKSRKSDRAGTINKDRMDYKELATDVQSGVRGVELSLSKLLVARCVEAQGPCQPLRRSAFVWIQYRTRSHALQSV